MALLKKTDVAKKYGVHPSTVTAALKANRLVPSMDGGTVLIDTENKDNLYQLNAWKAKINSEKLDGSVKSPEKVPQVKRKLTESQQLDLEKKRLSIEKQREDLEKVRLEKRKLSGDMVPTESVRSIFALLGSSFQKATKSGVENLLSELFHRAKVDPAIAAEFRSRLVDVINESHEMGLQGAKKELVKIIQSQTSTKK
jgi:hypothetical protein